MAAKTVLFYDRERKLAQLRAKAWAEGFAKGKAAGIAEQDRKWQGWFARREAAMQAGLPFNDPPPAPLD